MRELITIFCITTGVIFISPVISSAGVFSIGSYEKLYKVMNLPDDELYSTKEGQHVDLGIKYTMYQFLGLPVYQQDEPIFIGYLDKDNYLIFNKDIVVTIAELNNIKDVAILKQIPFWDKWGGKLMIGLITLSIILLLTLFFHSILPVIFSCK